MNFHWSILIVDLRMFQRSVLALEINLSLDQLHLSHFFFKAVEEVSKGWGMLILVQDWKTGRRKLRNANHSSNLSKALQFMTAARPTASNCLNRNNQLQNRLPNLHNNKESTTVTTAAACTKKGCNQHPSIVISQSNNLTWSPLKVWHSRVDSESVFWTENRLNFCSCLATSGHFIYIPGSRKRATDQPFHSSLTFAEPRTWNSHIAVSEQQI